MEVLCAKWQQEQPLNQIYTEKEEIVPLCECQSENALWKSVIFNVNVIISSNNWTYSCPSSFYIS